MAVTWRGSTVTPMMQAMFSTINTDVVLAAIVNTFRSRSKVRILRLVCQYDTTEPPTGTTSNRVMPIIRARKCSASNVSGGVEVGARPAWDTSIATADPGVKILFNPGAFGGPDTVISIASPTAPIWQQFAARQASSVEQVQSYDNSCLPALAAAFEFILDVGEALVLEQKAALPTGGVAWFNIAWEEDGVDVGYIIGGSVQLSGSPVNGAKVLLVTDSTTSMDSPDVETLTTNASGAFSKTVASGVKAAVFVQHENGGTKYTDEGKPFIEG